MQINNLVIEVTRKCNMTCEHCLRGCKQNINLDTKYVDDVLKGIDYICTVTFTGGEPSLNVPAIEYFLESCKKKRIDLGGFYIATNGLKIKEDFVLICLKLYSYCSEKETCQVQVSNDMYHEGNYNTELLDGLSFFGRKNEEENYSYKYGLIAEGRAIEFGQRFLKSNIIENEEDLNDTEIYLNCKGNIISGCDWSYKSQNKKANILCKSYELLNYLSNLPSDWEE